MRKAWAHVVGIGKGILPSHDGVPGHPLQNRTSERSLL
jgi:hypothetical protein